MIQNIISLDFTYSNIIKVSEEILNKNLEKFIFHNLEEKTTFKKNHKIFYTYLKYSNEYFVCFYENKNNAVFIIELIIKYIKTKKLCNKRVLVYYQDYLLLFENSYFYYFQKIENELQNQDIQVYIKKRFLFDYDEVINIENNELQAYKNKKIITSDLSYIHNNNELKFYYLYLFSLFFLCLSFLCFTYYEKESNKKELQLIQNNKTKQNKIIPKSKSLYFKMNSLFSTLEEHNIKISKFDFNKKSLTITLFAKNREDFYTFIQPYKNKKINSFFKTKEGYEINASFIF
ncbi:hypothetical protein [Arcobacter sp.]|uniref:hypothetical protein n=1 Tax=unclassified Arcobacter TaxID=2593671 RepID=UPI003AFFC16F